MTIKNKKWMRAGNSMHKTVDRQTARVTKWQTRDCRSQGRQEPGGEMKLEYMLEQDGVH